MCFHHDLELAEVLSTGRFLLQFCSSRTSPEDERTLFLCQVVSSCRRQRGGQSSRHSSSQQSSLHLFPAFHSVCGRSSETKWIRTRLAILIAPSSFHKSCCCRHRRRVFSSNFLPFKREHSPSGARELPPTAAAAAELQHLFLFMMSWRLTM